jgi:hypothetical protein
MLHVALQEHLRLFAVRRRGKRDDAEYAGTYFLGDRLDRASLAGGVPAFEQDDDPEFLFSHPFLQMGQLNLKLSQLLLIGLPLHSGGGLLIFRHRAPFGSQRIGSPVIRPRRQQFRYPPARLPEIPRPDSESGSRAASNSRTRA